MPKFKEIKSGLVYEFVSPWDVEQMRKHPEYLEIKEELNPVTSKIEQVLVEPKTEINDGYNVASSKRGPKKAS